MTTHESGGSAKAGGGDLAFFYSPESHDAGGQAQGTGHGHAPQQLDAITGQPIDPDQLQRVKTEQDISSLAGQIHDKGMANGALAEVRQNTLSTQSLAQLDQKLREESTREVEQDVGKAFGMGGAAGGMAVAMTGMKGIDFSGLIGSGVMGKDAHHIDSSVLVSPTAVSSGMEAGIEMAQARKSEQSQKLPDFA